MSNQLSLIDWEVSEISFSKLCRISFTPLCHSSSKLRLDYLIKESRRNLRASKGRIVKRDPIIWTISSILMLSTHQRGLAVLILLNIIRRTRKAFLRLFRNYIIWWYKGRRSTLLEHSWVSIVHFCSFWILSCYFNSNIFKL